MYIPSSNINKEKENRFPVDVFGIDKKKSNEEVSKELRRKINFRIKNIKMLFQAFTGIQK